MQSLISSSSRIASYFWILAGTIHSEQEPIGHHLTATGPLGARGDPDARK